MTKTPNDKIVFVTPVGSMRQLGGARLLIDSLRSFGGQLRDSPIWIFETAPQKAPCQSLSQPGVDILPLDAPNTLKAYPFGPKVYTCARAEEAAAGRFTSMIVVMPDCLFVQAPLLLELGPDHDAAVRPVHITNIGLPAEAPVDLFWKRVYKTIGVSNVDFHVFSFVERQRLRAYFNTATFAINPASGICSKWLETFEVLVGDPQFQADACSDMPHRIFLHQALLSTLLVNALDSQRIRILPPEYGYPYNLQESVPEDHRAASLNDLVHVIYEERSMNPDQMTDIEVREPLRSWLARYSSIASDAR